MPRMWVRSPFSDLLAAGLKDETQGDTTSVISDNSRAARRPPQTPDIRGLWKWLSPPAERRQRASACAPARNVFATDSPELGSSGLCGSGGTAPPAPPLCAPPPGDAVPPLPGLRALR